MTEKLEKVFNRTQRDNLRVITNPRKPCVFGDFLCSVFDIAHNFIFKQSNAPYGYTAAERIFIFQRLAAAATAVVIAAISVAEYEDQEDDDDPLAAAAVTKVKTTH